MAENILSVNCHHLILLEILLPFLNSRCAPQPSHYQRIESLLPYLHYRMKTLGAKFEYTTERNADLMRVYHEAICLAKQIYMPDVFRTIVNQPSARFWVSEERASVVISSMFRGGGIGHMTPQKQEMYREIFRRVLDLKRLHPRKRLSQLVCRVVVQPAPKFYLTPGSAQVIVSRVKNQWYRTRRPRHHRSS